MIIAVDFDGTLKASDGTLNLPLIEYLKQQQYGGASVILWTCREGKRLMDAVRVCGAAGLCFNAINNNTPEGIRRMGHDSRKIFADLYIDDKSIKP